MVEEWTNGLVRNARERCGVGRRRKAADDVSGRIDPLRKRAEQPDLGVGLHEGELLAKAIGPRAVIGVEPRQVGRARLADRRVERRRDAVRRLPDEANAAVGGGKTREHGHSAVLRSVVDDEEFEVGEILRPDARNSLRQPIRAVAHRHDDGDGGGHPSHRSLRFSAPPISPANRRNCHTPARPTSPMAQNAK
jgi:hypothetical protein